MNKANHIFNAVLYYTIRSDAPISLRKKRKLVYNVESNLTAYTDTGTFCIYFGWDKEDSDRCMELTRHGQALPALQEERKPYAG